MTNPFNNNHGSWACRHPAHRVHHPRPSLNRLWALRFVVYAKISLVSPRHESVFTAGRFLLLVTATTNFAFGSISIGLACLWDESKLEPVDRWYSAVAGVVTRVLLVGLTVVSVWGNVKEYDIRGIQKKEEVLALVGLSVLL